MASPNHLVDLTNIPEGVDPSFAGVRNNLYQRYRDGELTAEAALGGMASLYWAIQDEASPETRFYLADGRIDLAVEVGMDSDEASAIWQAGREDED